MKTTYLIGILLLVPLWISLAVIESAKDGYWGEQLKPRRRQQGSRMTDDGEFDPKIQNLLVSKYRAIGFQAKPVEKNSLVPLNLGGSLDFVRANENVTVDLKLTYRHQLYRVEIATHTKSGGWRNQERLDRIHNEAVEEVQSINDSISGAYERRRRHSEGALTR